MQRYLLAVMVTLYGSRGGADESRLLQKEEVALMTRRILLVFSVAAITAAMVIAPGVAVAQENASQDCKKVEDSGFGSQGGCTATFTPANNHTAGRATACQDPEFVEFIESAHGVNLKNSGQCIKQLRETFEPRP